MVICGRIAERHGKGQTCYGHVNSKEAVYILENKEGWVDKSSGPNKIKYFALNWH